MDRREFVSKALPAAAVGVAAGCTTETASDSAPAVHTNSPIRWRLASSFPRIVDTIYGGSEVLAKRVSAMTDGRFQIHTYPGGELVPALQVLDAAQQGTVEIVQTASYYFIGKNPALAFDTTIPFGLTSRQQTAWLLEGGGLDHMQRLFADFNVVNLVGGNTGVQMGGWFKRPIESLADLKGLKFRIPGLGGEVMNRLGVAVQVIAGGEIYAALERGAIDGTEWVGPYDDEHLGFHKIANVCYYPGWWEPGPSLSYLVNRKEWDKLSASDQEILRTAAIESGEVMQAQYDARNPAALRRLDAHGVDFRPYPEDILAAAERAARDVLEEQAAQNATYRTVYDAWRTFKRDSAHWFGTAELAFGAFNFPRAANG